MHLLENTPEALLMRKTVRALFGDDHHHAFDFGKGHVDIEVVKCALKLWQNGGIPPEDWLELCVASGAYMQIFATLVNDPRYLPSIIWVNLLKTHLPDDVYDFFVSYWLENAQEAVQKLKKLSKRYPNTFGVGYLFAFFKKNMIVGGFELINRITFSIFFRKKVYQEEILDRIYNGYMHSGYSYAPVIYFQRALLFHIPKILKKYTHIVCLDISDTLIKTCPDFVLKMPDLVVFNFIGTKLMYNLDFLKSLAKHKPFIYAGYAIDWTYSNYKQRQRKPPVTPLLPIPLEDILKFLYPHAVELLEAISLFNPKKNSDLRAKAIKWTNIFAAWDVLPKEKAAEYPAITELCDLFGEYQQDWQASFYEHYFYGG